MYTNACNSDDLVGLYTTPIIANLVTHYTVLIISCAKSAACSFNETGCRKEAY